MKTNQENTFYSNSVCSLKCILSIFLFVELVNSVNCYSQDYIWEWAKKAPRTDPLIFSSAHTGNSIMVDSDGNILVGGTASGTLNFGRFELVDEASVFAKRGFLTKYNSAGGVVWANRIEGRLVDLDIDNNGNIYTAILLSNEFIIKKFTSAGEQIWESRNSWTGAEVTINALAVDSSEGVVITGSYTGSGSLGESIILPQSHGKQDFFIAKYDDKGGSVWWKFFGGFGDDVGRDIVLGAGNTIYVTGSFKGQVEIGSEIIVSTTDADDVPVIDSFLAKFDSDGSIIWAKNIMGDGLFSRFSTGNAVELDLQGNVVVAGEIRSYISSMLGWYLLKYDDNGNSVWSKGGYTTFGLGTVRDLAIDSLNNVYLVAGNEFKKFAVTGLESGRSSIGGTGRTAVNALTTDRQGGIYLTGSVIGEQLFGKIRVDGDGIGEVITAKLKRNLHALPLADAIGLQNIIIKTGGSGEWYGQSNWIGSDSWAQSGVAGLGEENWMEFDVQGPARLVVQWGVNSLSESILYVNGKNKSSIIGGVIHKEERINLDAGKNIIRIVYTGNYSKTYQNWARVYSVKIYNTSVSTDGFRFLAISRIDENPPFGRLDFGLVELDIDNGREILIGHTDFYCDLNFDLDGLLYSHGYEALGTIDTHTGDETVLINYSSSQNFDAIAFSPEGELFAFDFRDYILIDLLARKRTIISRTSEWIRGMDFAEDGTLYGVNYDGELLLLDRSDGTLIKKIGSFLDVIDDIDYAPDGFVYGVSEESSSLQRIDLTTGIAEYIAEFDSTFTGLASESIDTPTLGDGIRTTLVGDSLILSWGKKQAVLEEAISVNGPWTEIPTDTDKSTHILITHGMKFFRIR